MDDLDPKFRLDKSPDRQVVVGRFEVAEQALRDVGARALQYAFKDMTKQVVYSQKPEIERVVEEYLTNKRWVEKALKAAFAEVVKEFMEPWGAP